MTVAFDFKRGRKLCASSDPRLSVAQRDLATVLAFQRFSGEKQGAIFARMGGAARESLSRGQQLLAGKPMPDKPSTKIPAFPGLTDPFVVD